MRSIARSLLQIRASNFERLFLILQIIYNKTYYPFRGRNIFKKQTRNCIFWNKVHIFLLVEKKTPLEFLPENYPLSSFHHRKKYLWFIFRFYWHLGLSIFTFDNINCWGGVNIPSLSWKFARLWLPLRRRRRKRRRIRKKTQFLLSM